jgi:hypothetical protein
MSNTVVISDQSPRLPSMSAGGSVRAIVPQDFEGAWRIASAVCKAQMAPKGLESPEKAMVAILHGLEVGLTPMNALQSIAIVNGRPTIWGDGAIGLVRGSNLLEYMDESFEGVENDNGFKAVCVVKRRGEPRPVSGSFSVADAKKAALWVKSGTWQQYPKRMLQMRARAFVLRDAFADVLKGLSIKEEVDDYQADTRSSHDEPPAPTMQHVDAPEIQPKPMASDSAPGGDPEPILKWIENTCASVESADELETVWNDSIAPRVDSLFPPDQEEAMGIYRKHENRLAP